METNTLYTLAPLASKTGDFASQLILILFNSLTRSFRVSDTMADEIPCSAQPLDFAVQPFDITIGYASSLIASVMMFSLTAV